FVVHTATNGVEALLQIKQWTPKAVILDLFMPRLGGLGTLHHIRRFDPGIVIILTSGVPNAVETVTKAGVSAAAAFAKPVEPAEILESLVRAGVARPKSPGAADLRNRVLVVDDEAEFREVLAEYLRSNGFDTLEACDGEEALSRIPDFRPQMVLLDIRMPGLDGVETLRRIKTLPQKTGVVMVSGLEDEETARQTLAIGASDYVCKPVDFGYLDSVLETHMLMAQFDPEPE
ncbi:MAG: response regulator, partial [Candidatus Methylomirabilia bacterium]